MNTCALGIAVLSGTIDDEGNSGIHLRMYLKVQSQERAPPD